MKKHKKRRIALYAAFALFIAAFAGFMGVGDFAPKERSLKIIDNEAVTTVSEKAAAESTEAGGKNSGVLDIEAKAAVLIDGTSGRVLYAQNEKEHLPPASVTKVMTILLILEGCESGKISFDDRVVISERAADMGGSQMYMEMGETHSVEELLKGVIMVSANDGCVALAEHLSGSVEVFVEEMNSRAKEMGLTDSNFINTNGLPVADHYSCAYDIGKISAELMKHEEAHEWFTTWQEDIKVGLPGKERKFTLTNTNKLIKTYNGAIGVKTGYTDDAGYCLSGAAERNGTRLIGVVLGCETSDIRFAEMRRLLDYGFSNYETIKVVEGGKSLKKAEIDRGSVDKVSAVATEDICMTINKGTADKVVKKIHLNKEIEAPIKKGDKVGALTIYVGDETKESYELVSDRDVDRIGPIKWYIRKIKKMI